MQSNQGQSELDIKAKKAREKSAKNHFSKGKAFFKEGNFVQAINAFEAACAVDRSNLPSFEMNYYLASAYEHSGKNQPADIQTKFNYADMAFKILAIPGAMKDVDLKKAAEVFAIRASARNELFKRKECSPKKREKELVLVALDYAIAVEMEKRPEHCIELAKVYLEQKKPVKVLHCLIKALEYAPKNQEAILFLNGFLLTWDACSTHNSERSSLDIYSAIHDLPKEEQFTVLDTLFSAIRLLPKENQFTLLRKFLNPLEEGRFRESLPKAEASRQKTLKSMWTYLTEIDPDKEWTPFKAKDDQYYFALGKTYLEKGEHEKAIRAFEMAFMYPPKQEWDVIDDDMYYYLASAHMAKQDALPVKERDYKIARNYLDRIEFPKGQPIKQYIPEYVLCSQLYYKIAITNEAKGIDLAGNSALYQKALEAAYACIYLQPNNASHFVTRALIYARMKNPVKALEDLLAAYRIPEVRRVSEDGKFELQLHRQKIQTYLYHYLMKLDEATLNLVSIQQMFAAIRLLPQDNQVLLLRKCLYDLQSPLSKWTRKDATLIKIIHDDLKKLDPSYVASDLFVEAPYANEDHLSFDQYLQFGKAFYNEQKYEEAMQCFNKAISLKEGSELNKEDRIKLSRAYYNRGMLHYATKQFDNGIKDMEEAQRLDPALFAFTGFTRSQYINSLSLFNDEPVIFIVPNADRYKELFDFTHGLSCSKKNDYYCAILHFGEVIKKKDSKNLAASYYLQAKTFMSLQNDAKYKTERWTCLHAIQVNVIENLFQALTLDSHFTEAAELLNSYLLFQITEHDLKSMKGEKLFSVIKSLAKEQQIYLLQNILSKSNNKQPMKLLREFAHKHHLVEKMHAHLIKLDPDNYKTYYNGVKLTDKALFAVGNHFYKQGRIKQGESIHAAVNSSKFDVHYQRGAAYLAQARNDAESYEDMKSDMTTAIDSFAKSKNAKAYYQSGVARLFLKDKKAWSHFTIAIATKPKVAQVYNMRGLVHYVDKKYDDAIEDFKSAIDCYSNFADAHLQLALAYEAKNDKTKAIEQYIEAIQIDKVYTKASSKGERVSKKQKLKPLFVSTDENFAPHLAEVNQALTSPADRLTSLLLNIKTGELDGISRDKLVSMIKELPTDKQIAIFDQCLLENSPLGQRFRKLGSAWDIKQMVALQEHLLQLKVIHSTPAKLVGNVQVQPVEVQALDVPSTDYSEMPQVQSTNLSPVYIQTVVQPQIPTPVTVEIPKQQASLYPPAYQEPQQQASPPAYQEPQQQASPPAYQEPRGQSSLYPSLCEQPQAVFKPVTSSVVEQQPTPLYPIYQTTTQPQTPAPVAVPTSALYPKLSDETPIPHVFPVVPAAGPQFTNNTAVTFFQPSVVAPVSALSQPLNLPVAASAPLETIKTASAPSNAALMTYQQQKLRANETLRKYLEKTDSIKEMRKFLEDLKGIDRKPWTVKSLFKKERPGIPSHIKEVARLLSQQHSCLSYDSGTIWLFNKVLDIFAKLDPNSSYRTDSVKAFDKSMLDDGNRIKELHEKAEQGKKNQKAVLVDVGQAKLALINENKVAVSNQTQKNVSSPNKAVLFQPTITPAPIERTVTVLEPVYISTNDLNALPSVPVKKAFSEEPTKRVALKAQ